jgi:hypothetical protein
MPSGVVQNLASSEHLAEPVARDEAGKKEPSEPMYDGGASDEDLDYAPSFRTPEQEARRKRFLHLVAGLVGAFGVVSIFAVARLVRDLSHARGGGARPSVSASRPNAATAAAGLPTAGSTVAPVGSGRPTAAALAPTPSSSSAISFGSSLATAPGRVLLPVVDLESPETTDPGVQDAWSQAARSLRADNFDGADKAFAELGRSKDPPTRETARLARALLWISQGRDADVKPVVEDLAANASTSVVRKRAKDLLREAE